MQERLGSFDHFCAESDVEGTDKHHIAHGFVVEPRAESFELDAQHEAIRMVETIPDDVHDYVDACLRAADLTE